MKMRMMVVEGDKGLLNFLWEQGARRASMQSVACNPSVAPFSGGTGRCCCEAQYIDFGDMVHDFISWCCDRRLIVSKFRSLTVCSIDSAFFQMNHR